MARLTDGRVKAMLLLLCVAFVSPALAVGQTPPNTSDQLDQVEWNKDPTRRFIAVHGRRAAIFGYSENGLEVWVYPFQIVTSLSISFRPQGATTLSDGQALIRRVTYSPESVTRVYAGPDFIVREKLFVPLDQTGAVVTYQVDGVRPVDIEVRFTPVLDLMWPASVGVQETAWDPEASAYRLTEPRHRFAATIGSPDIVGHDETTNGSRGTRELAFTLRAGGGHNTARFVVAGAKENVTELARMLLEQRAALEKAASDHYSSLLRRALEIETPDADTNRALAWSEVALDQAWVCNPDLGCGLVAGYGPSRKARRPQYVWFFAGDGMVAIRALLAAGDYARAREELEFILKFRDQKTGMIWHELSQSAGWLDWDQYPYKFLHVDLTFQFLATVGKYAAVTGDLDFVRANWGAIQSAYDYCQSLVDSQDGLPRIPSEKRGQREQEELGDELALSASWAAAAQAFRDLAAAAGHVQIAEQAGQAGQRAIAALSQRYWDEQQNFWITGHTRSGAPLVDRGLGPVSVLETQAFSPEQREKLLDQFASSAFQTDWGTRGKASSAGTYAPNSYASGSVWAIGTASVAQLFWDQHRPASALPIWSALVPWNSLDSPGHMHEALAGDYYHEEVESVPEQTWSSASFLTSFVNGLLGLRVEGVSRHITLAPHLPAAWSAITLWNVSVGSSAISIHLLQSPAALQLQVQNDGAPARMVFDPEIPLGARISGARLDGRPVAATAEAHEQDDHARVEFDLPHGSTSLALSYRGGVAMIPDPPQLMIGEASRAIKVIGIHRDGRVYTVDFDYLPSVSSSFDVRTSWRLEKVEGATVEAPAPALYRFTVPAAANQTAHDYQHGKVVMKFGPED